MVHHRLILAQLVRRYSESLFSPGVPTAISKSKKETVWEQIRREAILAGAVMYATKTWRDIRDKYWAPLKRDVLAKQRRVGLEGVTEDIYTDLDRIVLEVIENSKNGYAINPLAEENSATAPKDEFGVDVSDHGGYSDAVEEENPYEDEQSVIGGTAQISTDAKHRPFINQNNNPFPHFSSQRFPHQQNPFQTLSSNFNRKRRLAAESTVSSSNLDQRIKLARLRLLEEQLREQQAKTSLVKEQIEGQRLENQLKLANLQNLGMFDVPGTSPNDDNNDEVKEEQHSQQQITAPKT